MAISTKNLEIKTSTLPNAGKGLFTKIAITKGQVIIEYKGRRRKWKDVEDDVDNGYIYHIDDENVIDAKTTLTSFGRYANDAAGLQRVKGVTNNAEYVEFDNRVYIKAVKNITAGGEIFVPYGKLYWQQVRENIKIDAKEKAAKKTGPAAHHTPEIVGHHVDVLSI